VAEPSPVARASDIGFDQMQAIGGYVLVPKR
jgi:hypothetical protein